MDPTAARKRVRDAQRTRQRILAVARASFARSGYGGTNIRGIAAEAGVAPNLITRYFGGKAGLFRAATSIDLNVPNVLPGPYDELGARIAARVVERWEAADAADPLLMMLRSAGTSDAAAEALGAFLTAQASGPIFAHLAGERGCSEQDAAARTAAIGALITGVVMARYVIRTSPLAGAGATALRAWLADQLQRLLNDPAPPPLAE
jgi:AcrR family transcriptional regulator